jgi:flagellar hook-associated protein 2
MAGIALGGLASGLDTESMISQLMQIDAQPSTRWAQQKKVALVREQALRDVHTRVKNLHNVVKDLKSVATWLETQSVDSSEPSKLGVTRTGGAGPGAYSVSVRQLATSDQWNFKYSPPSEDTSFTITTNAGRQTVALPAGTDLDTAVGIINASSDSKAYAVNVSGRLVLSSRATGTSSMLTVDPPADSSPIDDAQHARSATNAEYSSDNGITWQSSESNVVKNGIPGIDLVLKGLTAAGAQVTVNVGAPAPDYTAIKQKIRAFVDQYNSTIDFIRSKTTEERVKDPKTDSDRAKGVLFNDTGLNGILSRLRSAAGLAFDTGNSNVDQLAEIGITTGASKGTASSADALAGKLEFDEAKLSAALSSDPVATRKLLGAGGVDGVAQKLGSLLEPLTTTNGDFDQRIKSASGDQKRYQDQIDAMSKRISARTQQLRAQFSAMESAIQHSQATSSWRTRQLR